jgi:hypothetical protein
MSLPTTTTSFTTFLEGKRFLVSVRSRDSYEGRSKTPRVYVSCPDPEALGQTDGHPAYTQKGADPVADAGWKAYNKLEMANQRHFAEAAVTGKLSFSRKAGCSMCPCSPGFVVKEGGPRGWALDLWVTATAY